MWSSMPTGIGFSCSNRRKHSFAAIQREGRGSSGLTPYFLLRALPQQHPPPVRNSSAFCKTAAKELPFLAFRQIGQPYSQYSGSFGSFRGTFQPRHPYVFKFLIPFLTGFKPVDCRSGNGSDRKAAFTVFRQTGRRRNARLRTSGTGWLWTEKHFAAQAQIITI